MLEVTVDAALNWKGVLVNLGWDTAVFSLGLGSSVFTDSNAEQFYGTNDAILGAVGCFAASLFAITMILLLRREKRGRSIGRPFGPTGFTGIISLLLGGVAFLAPVYFHVHALGFRWACCKH